jgi:predicted permease
MRSLGLIETTWRDLRYGARLLRRSPGFALIAVLSLGLGIGANTALFQLMDAVRLRALPVAKPEALAMVRIAEPSNGRMGRFTGRYFELTYPLWRELEPRVTSFDGLFAWAGVTFDLAVSGESRPVEGLYVTGDFYSTLGVRPAAGRLPGVESDSAECREPAVVISHRFWQREFASDPAAIGRTLSVNGVPLPITGVTEASFFGLEVGRQFDVALPACAQALLNPSDNALTNRSWWWLSVMGRLREGVSAERATAELQALSPDVFGATVPPTYQPSTASDYKAFRLAVVPAAQGVSRLREAYAEPLALLLGIAGLVLLIACGNLANLMLARASTRRREIAVRLAIGASRSRLVRQLMAESLLVAAAGAALGAWLAGVLGSALVTFLATPSSPVSVDLTPNWRMALFATGLGALTCLAFGLMPALRATRAQASAALGSRGETDPAGRFRLRGALVVAQLAVSLVLLVGSLLFVLTFYNVARIDPGIDTEGVLVAEFDYRRAGITEDGQPAFQRTFMERVRAVPGIGQIARVGIVPLGGSTWNQLLFIDGQAQDTLPLINRVDGGYFALVGSPIVAGRTFDERDRAGSAPSAIVTERFVEQYLGGRDPVGRTFHFDASPGETPVSYSIVGIARNVRYADVHDEVQPVVYLAMEQETEYGPLLRLLVRPDAATTNVISALSALARERSGVVVRTRTLDGIVAQALVRERLMAVLAGFFGGVAALLAAIGLYGVMSYMVARRRQEIGVRMALGAGRGDILLMVLREAGALMATGVLAGSVLAAALARFAQSLLFGLTATDARVIGGAALLLTVVAALASLWPALRAASVPPTTALRDA